MLNRFNSVKETIKDSQAYRAISSNVSTLFHQSDEKDQPLPELSRFNSAAELTPIRDAFTKMKDKQVRLSEAADDAGEASNEYAASEVLRQVILICQEKIDAFNGEQIKPDSLSNVKEMHQLTQELKTLISIDEDDSKKLDDMKFDKPFVKNAALTVGVYGLLPALPLFILGPGAIAVVLGGLSGVVVAKPANDYLTKEKIINWDTESKAVLTGLIESIDKVDSQLARYLEQDVAAESKNSLKL